MRRDPTVIVMGEDIVGGAGGSGEEDAWGGALGVTKGLYAKEFGRSRARHAAVGDAAISAPPSAPRACGMRPVAELMFIDFIGVLPRPDLQPGRQVPLHVRRQGRARRWSSARMVGAGLRAAAQHSQMLTPLFTHIPGIKVVVPVQRL